MEANERLDESRIGGREDVMIAPCLTGRRGRKIGTDMLTSWDALPLSVWERKANDRRLNACRCRREEEDDPSYWDESNAESPALEKGKKLADLVGELC